MSDLPEKIETKVQNGITIVDKGGVVIAVAETTPMAAEIVRRYNGYEGLLATIENALLSLKVIKMPRLDNSVATDADILKIMEESLVAAIEKAKEIK